MLDPILLSKILLTGLVFSTVVLAADRPAGQAGAGRSAVVARNGMVATSQPLASQAGLRILQQGGNAIDAAVATAATLAVVEPMMTGPGGDMFALVYMANDGELAGLNGSGFSPAAADLEFFQSRGLDQIPITGPFSVSVPGAVDGWATLLDRHGTMTLAEVLQPAIEYADQGFAVSEIIAGAWAAKASSFGADPHFAAEYLLRGEAPKHGDVIANPGLAWTYRQLAQGGRDAFYKGEIARRIVGHLNSLEWPVTMDDLAAQHSDWVEPISTTYKGYRLYELPPNGQGMAALEMLNILEGFDLRPLGHNSTAYLHHLIEAKKLAFADLDAWLADFLVFLEKRIGPGRTLIALSSDHGVLPLPEWLLAQGQATCPQEDGRRSTLWLIAGLYVDLWYELSPLFSKPGAWMHAGATGLRVNKELAEKHGVDPQKVIAMTKLLLESEDVVEKAWTREEILSGTGEFARLYRNSYDPERSADLTIQIAEGCLLWPFDGGTSHGSPYLYDREVPIVFWGTGVQSGAVDGPARTIDIAPSVAKHLGVPAPENLEGRPLP